MAKIVLSDLAPAGASFFSLANTEVEVPYETDDTTVIGAGIVHPWLNVEPTEAEIAAAEVETVEEAVAHLAIEAGLDQNEPQHFGEVATTVAAGVEDAAEAEAINAEADAADAPAEEPKPVQSEPKPAKPPVEKVPVAAPTNVTEEKN